MPNFEKQAELFKLLSNPIRLQIIDILSKKEASLEELTETIGIRKPNTSQHLAILRYLRIVKSRRDGKRTLYNITNSRINKLLQLAQVLKYNFLLELLNLPNLYIMRYMLRPPLQHGRGVGRAF
jgi:DNA-binding transcriptional ArsR family regulator